MMPFELVEPATLGEAITLLDPDDPTVRPIAGGTALMLMMKAGVFRPTRLVSLRKLGAQYARIAPGANGALAIGSMTPLAAVERSPEVARAAPVIPRAMRRLSNIRVRNVATIGGNLAHGDPHMDLPPILIALGAEVAVAGPKGERTIAVEDLFAGYFETVLAKNELIAELRIPPQGSARATYLPQVWEQLPGPRLFLTALMKKAELPADMPITRCKVWRYQVKKWREVDLKVH